MNSNFWYWSSMTPEQRYRNLMMHKRRGSTSKVKLSDDEQLKILDYLKNPTGVGLWKLDGIWQQSKGFTNYFQKLLEKNKTNDRRLSYASTRLETMAENPNLILHLFSKIIDFNNQKVTDGSSRSIEDEMLEDIKDSVYPEIAKEYSEALLYFENNIYCGWVEAVNRYGFVRTKTGSFLVTEFDNSSKNKIEIIAFEGKTLCAIQDFFRLLSKIESDNIYTIFSPDEELLQPYIDTLDLALRYTDMQDGIKNYFKKMVYHYNDENYTSCVTTAGLVAEECLTQIYETLSRSPMPKGMMLGQTSSIIGEVVKKNLSPQKDGLVLSNKEMSEKIKAILDHNQISPKSISSVAKLLIKYSDSKTSQLNSEVKGLTRAIDVLNNRDVKSDENGYDYNIYPNLIKLNLKEVIFYRNAASHKSTYPIDSLVALKCVHSSFSLIMWWSKQRVSIQNSKTSREVIEQLIESSKSYC